LKNNMPSLDKLAFNFGKAITKYIASGFKSVNQEEYSIRINICNQCNLFQNGRCHHENCGCFINKKAWWASENCPENKWPSHYDK